MIRLPRKAEIWLPGYLSSTVRSVLRSLGEEPAGTVWLAVCDHYEPVGLAGDEERARIRVRRWCEAWPRIAARHLDSDGQPAQYIFFYPAEEYRPHLLEALAGIVRSGFGDVEVHVHHGGEGQQAFVDLLSTFLERLAGGHGLLHRDSRGPCFGFIHGNWALDNSLPRGRHCGLNNEISLLRQLNCYADFTMPSAPSESQARMLNQIYWAKDDPDRPKSHDRGVVVKPGGRTEGDLLIIPGPFSLKRGRGIIPRLDNGELAFYDPPTANRARLWLRMAPRVGNNIFIKLYSHGAVERNLDVLLAEDGALDQVFEMVRSAAVRKGHRIRFVTAHGMFTAVEAARASSPAVT